jgi:hypothetical protein
MHDSFFYNSIDSTAVLPVSTLPFETAHAQSAPFAAISQHTPTQNLLDQLQSIETSTTQLMLKNLDADLSLLLVPTYPPDDDTSPMSEAALHGIGVKPGVNMSNLGSQIVSIFSSIAAAFSSNGATPVITSANDGQHMPGSQHYVNQAIDLRANNISSSTATAIVAALTSSLGSSYFVQYETFPSTPSNNHIHIQAVK